MKRILVLILILVPFFASCQHVRYESPQVILFDVVADADGYEFGAKDWLTSEITIIATILTTTFEFIIGPMSGAAVVVRSYKDVDTPEGIERVFSEWSESTDPADVADGQDTFYVTNFTAGKPRNIRVE